MKTLRIYNQFASVMGNVPKSLVDLQHSHFLNLKTVYIQFTNESYVLNLEVQRPPGESEDIMDINENIELTIDPENTVSQFTETCKQLIPNINNATLYSLEKTPLAGISTMEQVIQEPFYIVSDKNHSFYVKQFAGYDQDQYSYIKDYCTRKDIPLLEKNILLSYLRRIDNLLEQNYSTNFFKNNSASKTTLDHNSLVSLILDSYLDQRNTQSDHEQDMYQQYYELKMARERLETTRDELLEAAKKMAKFQMFGGLLVLCGHFCFMGAGIYVYYDWNVMEPIGYFLNTGGVIYLSYQYFKLQGDWTHSKFSEYLIKKNFNRLAAKHDFNPKQLEMANLKIQEIQDRIKTNLVTNL